MQNTLVPPQEYWLFIVLRVVELLFSLTGIWGLGLGCRLVLSGDETTMRAKQIVPVLVYSRQL